jgi:hypothetical protein
VVGTGDAVAKWYSGTWCFGGIGNTITVLPGGMTFIFYFVMKNVIMTSCFSTTVTVNTTVSAASSTPTVCLNTLMPSITHTTVNATGIELL